MKSRYRAEALIICEDGLSHYLADKHNKRISSGVLTGVLIGGLSSTALYFYQSITGETSENFMLMLPLLMGSISGAGYGVITSNKNDAADTADFDTVCESLESEEEEDDEEESDGKSNKV